MKSLRDLLWLGWGSIVAHRLRSGLTMLGIVIGIASVMLLTSLGEGTRRSILSEFTQFGTSLMKVSRGRVQTTGIPGSIGATVRKLTIEDAEAIKRVPGVEHLVPMVVGAARVEVGEKGRGVVVYGVTAEVPLVWRFAVRQGRFLPAGDPRRGAPLTVLGPTLKRELFGAGNALGEHVKIEGRRFLVVGVMEPKGQFLGFDLDDAAYVPVAVAQSLFNTSELAEIDILFSEGLPDAVIRERVRQAMMARHDNQEDFTILTQTEMLDVLNRVLGVITLAVGGIGGISLLVGAIGILTMMWISVGERTAEIGLARAIGASRGQIVRLFLLEAALLSLAGGVLGVVVGAGLGALLRLFVPGLPLSTAPEFVVLALVVSLVVGLAAGAMPARRAASLDPVEALRAE